MLVLHSLLSYLNLCTFADISSLLYPLSNSLSIVNLMHLIGIQFVNIVINYVNNFLLNRVYAYASHKHDTSRIEVCSGEKRLSYRLCNESIFPYTLFFVFSSFSLVSGGVLRLYESPANQLNSESIFKTLQFSF